jgi:hypothetical protein
MTLKKYTQVSERMNIVCVHSSLSPASPHSLHVSSNKKQTNAKKEPLEAMNARKQVTTGERV